MIQHEANFHFVICDRSSNEFMNGRNLTKKIYNKTWGTDEMSDDYDVGVVAFHNSKPVGNVNIQLRKNRDSIPSERFFYKENWTRFKNVEAHLVGEISGLSASEEVRGRLRHDVVSGLVACVHLAALQVGVPIYSTIQRQPLIRKLVDIYQYPFSKVCDSKPNIKAIPNDKYWAAKELPQLFFIDYRDVQATKASFEIIKELSKKNVKIQSKV